MRRTTLALALLLVAGCMHGTNVRTFTPAISPAGVNISFRLIGERTSRSGELYAADSTGITVRTDRLVHVAWSRLLRVYVPGRGTFFDATEARGQTVELKQQLALMSRFPQGLDGALLGEVLRLLSQDALVTLP